MMVESFFQNDPKGSWIFFSEILNLECFLHMLSDENQAFALRAFEALFRSDSFRSKLWHAGFGRWRQRALGKSDDGGGGPWVFFRGRQRALGPWIRVGAFRLEFGGLTSGSIGDGLRSTEMIGRSQGVRELVGICVADLRRVERRRIGVGLTMMGIGIGREDRDRVERRAGAARWAGTARRDRSGWRGKSGPMGLIDGLAGGSTRLVLRLGWSFSFAGVAAWLSCAA
ncbi:hypothetical protein M0R45_026043 [Rubus argutus]|uniref:Uncharacterized protein n=1 Tax=Rubus argutus TaxID=59490 RepID=A0AAW1WW71_RUBAR